MKRVFCIFILITFSHASDYFKKEYMFDETTLTYYIPFELWLGIAWNGKKEKHFTKLENNGSLSGYYNWYHPYLKKHINVYKHKQSSNNKLFTLYPKGIATVYEQEKEAYYNNGVFFPAGFGWKINKLYTFSQEMWKYNKHYTRTTAIIITDISFDKKSNFEFLTYSFFINGKLQESHKIYPIKEAQ